MKRSFSMMRTNRRSTLLFLIASTFSLCLMAQEKSLSSSHFRDNGQDRNSSQSTDSVKEDPCIPVKDERHCWRLDPMTGLKYPCQPDTSYLGLGSQQCMESKALALVHTGNLYSPHQVQAYFDREADHEVIFLNAYNLFRTDPSKQIYYNSKLPCTVLSYSKEGGGLQTNDHLKLNFFGNFNRQLGLGSSLDYVYARGEYAESAAKPLNWNNYLYYEGDQYKAYLSFTLSKLANQENGGISDRGYVLNPDNYSDNFTDPKNMPTNLVSTWNDTRQKQLHFQHSYDLGMWKEHFSEEDSTTWDEFIPVASIFQSFNFEGIRHNFRMDEGADIAQNGFFEESLYNDLATNDSIRYSDFTTYAGIRLNEGFSKFSQFSISGFVGFQHEHYRMMPDSTGAIDVQRNKYCNNLWLGGQLSRHLSSLLTFDATARIAMAGSDAGCFDISGQANMTLPFGHKDPESGQWSDSLLLEAKASTISTTTSHLMERYFSNHFYWKNTDFDPEQRVRIEGKISYPRTRTSARIGIEHINNYHYFGNDCRPHEFDKQLDIFAFEARQTLWAGRWLQWDNALLVQTTTQSEVLDLPKFSFETDLSLHFRIARTLAIQAGVAGYYYTRYYAPMYQPATQQFCTQNKIKCGNYPLLNGYVNCNLKRIKFFMAVHNLIENSATNDMFIMPYYPHQSRRIEYGLILDLQN